MGKHIQVQLNDVRGVAVVPQAIGVRAVGARNQTLLTRDSEGYFLARIDDLLNRGPLELVIDFPPPSSSRAAAYWPIKQSFTIEDASTQFPRFEFLAAEIPALTTNRCPSNHRLSDVAPPRIDPPAENLWMDVERQHPCISVRSNERLNGNSSEVVISLKITPSQFTDASTLISLDLGGGQGPLDWRIRAWPRERTRGEPPSRPVGFAGRPRESDTLYCFGDGMATSWGTRYLEEIVPEIRRGEEQEFRPRGRLFVLQRRVSVGPLLYFVWVPENYAVANAETDSREQVKINYHVFFHPTFGPNHAQNICQPFTELLRIPEYYLLYGSHDPRLPPVERAKYTRSVNKTMIYQSALAAKPVVLVLPLGNLRGIVAPIASCVEMERVLGEISFWIQRNRKVPGVPLRSGVVPNRFPDRVALSGFSRAQGDVQNVIQSEPSSLEGTSFRDALEEIYLFAPSGLNSERVGRLVQWWRERPGVRALRVYAETERVWTPWRNALERAGGQLRAAARSGMREVHVPNGSYVLVTNEAIWEELGNGEGFSGSTSHQLYPGFFMYHALRNSAFVGDQQGSGLR